MSDVRKPDFGYAGQILPHVAIANSLQSPHTEKLAFLPNPLSAFYLKPACCLKNCDRDKKSSFSTVSAKNRHSWLGPNTLSIDASVLGRKRGIFVLVADVITNDNNAMNTLSTIDIARDYRGARHDESSIAHPSGCHSGLSRPPQGRTSRPQGRSGQRRQRFLALPRFHG